MPKKLTQEEFLAKAVAVHGVGRYDYSQTVYLPQPQKIAIRCPEHGIFEQVANMHMQGKGCKKCANNQLSKGKTLDTLAFVQAAQARHGKKYDYSQVVYTHGKERVKIGCSAHGLFEQQASNHTQGQGCPMCAGVLRGQTQSSGVALGFISRAIAAHGARYDYSRVVYRNSKSLIQVICPLHGLFEQRAHNHLAGKACKYCVGPLSQNTETFVERARMVHGERYDYSQTIYKRAKLKLKIICPIHGLFEQEAGSHILGCGCPDCAFLQLRKSWVEKSEGKKCILYFLRVFSDFEIFYKVGITATSVSVRYKTIKSLKGYQYELLAMHTSTSAEGIYNWERSILETFAHLRYKPKRRFNGETECFSSADEILAIFPL